MKISKRLSTGNPILDNIISSLIYFVAVAAVPVLWKIRIPLTGNEYVDKGISFTLLVLTIVVPFFAACRIYRIWSWSSENTSIYLKELKKTLRGAHPSVRPLLALIAKESAAHLVAARPGGGGGVVTLDEYINLLEESIDCEKLVDVTFIAKTKPSYWGDGEKREQCNDIQKHAWRYFNKQKALKHRKPKKVRMRRYLAISMNDYKSDDKELKEKFEAEHEDAKIDLRILPPNTLTKTAQAWLKDLALFWDEYGNGWIVCSDFDEEALTTKVVKNVQVIHHAESLLNCSSDFLKEVLSIGSRPEYKLFEDTSNCPPEDFLRKIHVIK